MTKKRSRPKAIYVLFDGEGDQWTHSYNQRTMLQEMRYFNKRSQFAPFDVVKYIPAETAKRKGKA